MGHSRSRKISRSAFDIICKGRRSQIVFSLTEIESFEKTETWLESILKHKNLDEIAIAILGNKKIWSMKEKFPKK